MELQPGPERSLGFSLKGGKGGLSVAILYCPRGRYKILTVYGIRWTKTRFVPFSTRSRSAWWSCGSLRVVFLIWMKLHSCQKAHRPKCWRSGEKRRGPIST
ncbi:hypothetical protein JG688_00015852 [Phytophthora aleatoria]|uniref:Uncharacterized protein n=1 Tax=Phytophthora aleatoria TaxID=2496075 RepID=A0A8J5ISL8_9STRA|nr:hypothetical protein JG688_00015852 [Phytophthora aleatoria]